MPSIVAARRLATLLLFGGTVALAQSTLPATAPTSTPPPAPNPIAETQPGHRASVLYARGQLTILADNSSLNQILRDVARQTGMTIAGSVADQRVFGKIGPASPAEVLTGLLDGTGTDMMLRVTASQVPTELVLTPRQGTAAPSSPFPREAKPRASYSPDADSTEPMPPSIAQRPPNPTFQSGSPTAPPGVALDISAPGSPSAETPQQVYQRMLQLQRSQPLQPAPPQ